MKDKKDFVNENDERTEVDLDVAAMNEAPEAVPAVVKYDEAEIDSRIIRAVKEMGYEEMTPIQQMAIPVLLEGKDIIGQAQTGTGKTAAFGIPLIQAMDPDNENVQGIVLCPTRELAIQAAEELRLFAKYMHGIKVLPVYGGQDIEKQIRSLRSKATIVVGTPGRVMDHMRRKTLKLEDVSKVVLDEADEMLDMGFREDIETILAEVPENHQTALFSATMPQSILDIVKCYQKNAVMITTAKKELTIPLVKQYYYEVLRQNKEEVVSRLLDYYNPKQSLIFCNTKRMVDDLTEKLKGRGYFAEGLHGDMSQLQRDKVMKGFRNGTVEILIATDVAARGIDVDDIEAVFNYDIPQDDEYYVHRIGRTGRAGRKGRSFTLVVGREIYRIRDIERTCNTKIKARVVPSVADITAAKSQKVFAKVLELVSSTDLSDLTKIVQDKLNDEDITAIDLCAGFLRMHLGETKEDIPTESYFESRNKRLGGRNGKNAGSRYSDYSAVAGKRNRSRYGRDDSNSSYDNGSAGEEGYSNRKRDYGKRSDNGAGYGASKTTKAAKTTEAWKTERTAKNPGASRTDRTAKNSGISRTERTERTERTAKNPGASRTDRTERTAKNSGALRTERTAKNPGAMKKSEHKQNREKGTEAQQ